MAFCVCVLKDAFSQQRTATCRQTARCSDQPNRTPSVIKGIIFTLAVSGLVSFLRVHDVYAEAIHYSGHPRVVDGDTLVLNDQRIRLKGIDAFEVRQTCASSFGKPYLCGTVARAQLEHIIGDLPISCVSSTRDVYGRELATCTLPTGQDVASRMVEDGWALAYRRYSNAYVGLERAAREDKR